MEAGEYLKIIRNQREQGAYEEARATLQNVWRDTITNSDLAVEKLGLSFCLDSWQLCFELLTSLLKKYSFRVLCGGKNLNGFLGMVNHSYAFHSALVIHLLAEQRFETIRVWSELMSNQDGLRILESWKKQAEQAESSQQTALLEIAVGIYYFQQKNLEQAWQYWSSALKKAAKFMDKLIAFCKTTPHFDHYTTENRARLIELIFATGKEREALSLLKALGLESVNSAIMVIKVCSKLRVHHLAELELLKVRYRLALFVEQEELLLRLILEMEHLQVDPLFDFQKLTLLKVQDPYLKQVALLKFAEIWIQNYLWNQASILLQSLYDEGPHPKVVPLMESVVAKDPSQTSLLLTLGSHYLKQGQGREAVHHLALLSNAPRHREKVICLLENYLSSSMDIPAALLLVELLPIQSAEAGLLACSIGIHGDEELKRHLDQWLDLANQSSINPFWYFAFINGYIKIGDYEKSYSLMNEFLKRCPTLSSELVRPAELLADNYQGDFQELITVIGTQIENLEPKTYWQELCLRFNEMSKKNKQAKVLLANQEKAKIKNTLEKSAYAPQNLGIDGFCMLLNSGHWQIASEVAEKMITKSPEKYQDFLKVLSKLPPQNAHQLHWVVSILWKLTHLDFYAEAIAFGEEAINLPSLNAILPELHQALALAFDKSGQESQALGYYCLSARQANFYQSNRQFFGAKVLPKYRDYLKNVLGLVRTHRDQVVWKKLMRLWFRHFPEEKEELIQAQIRFTTEAGTPRSYLDLAFWYFQVGRTEQANRTLSGINLKDPEIRNDLVHIASLVNMKYPNNPKPDFLLGKYYLIHKETPKAVDTFRHLARQKPNVSEIIYQFLRTQLKGQPDHLDNVYLYGLLIRIALDSGFSISAVKLLEEFGHRDQPGAESLAEGVFRVILRQKERDQALFMFAKLMRNWGSYGRMLFVLEHAQFGKRLIQERLHMLDEAKAVSELRDRATLAIAQVYFDNAMFAKCCEILLEVKSYRHKQEALLLYESLVERFPEQTFLWQDAGWAAFLSNPSKARTFFLHLYEYGKPDQRLEAFAFLKELGETPDFEHLINNFTDENFVYRELRKTHERIRDFELANALESKTSPSFATLEWMLLRNRIHEFNELYATHPHLSPHQKIRLEALRYQAQGQALQAAWFLIDKTSVAEIQSHLYQVGLFEQAVLQNSPETRLPQYIRKAFLKSYQQPKVILARASHIQKLSNQVQALMKAKHLQKEKGKSDDHTKGP